MGLKEYRKKRDFGKTPEPSGKAGKKAARPDKGPLFVVQKHDASRLHYDFRLEMDGVLKSWAVPKGPSLDPSQKRLAVRTEDHPLEYADFEGIIPEGEYGGGTVMVWDIGAVEFEGTEQETARLVEDRKPLVFELKGSKLSGRWRLVPFGGKEGATKNWLWIKSRDNHSRDTGDILADEPDSAKTGRTLEEIAEAGEEWSGEEADYGQ